MFKIEELYAVEDERCCDQSKDIKILLLGRAGTEKSTFINGLLNYICNDTLTQTVQDEFQVAIPSTFSYTDDDAKVDRVIRIGDTKASKKS
ncbi:unnamed protein product [Adineta ricciae]|uniref:G domain-containing protein n=1 Tax=Adineta ricciae TaxID=249248 RepID=A0A816FJY9_ADIRI|nr:unnamed protein product [Adineta ricciae]CAF1662618.1 unnamed protein product [Adineta ricciae]